MLICFYSPSLPIISVTDIKHKPKPFKIRPSFPITYEVQIP